MFPQIPYQRGFLKVMSIEMDLAESGVQRPVFVKSESLRFLDYVAVLPIM
jgi:hypothetical protein